jgi:hypothetical protein
LPRLSVEQLEDRTTPSATLVLSGAQTIVPGANINVSNNDTTTESEMLIAVNPANPLNVAGFVHSATNLNDIQLFFSSNGGTTWTRRLITSTSGAGLINDGFGAGSRFDPSIAFDRLGNLYVAYGHNTGPGGSSRLVVGSSADGGATFARFTVIDVQANVTFVDSNGQTKTLPGVDKWHLATGLDPSTGNQAVYIAYGQIVMEGTDIDQRITVSGSNNAGATFTPPLTIADDAIAGIGRGLFAHPGVGPNGELYVSWGSGGIRFDRDLDGLFATNSTFGTDTTIITPQPFGPDPLPVQPRRGTGNNPVLAVYQGGGSLSGRIYMAYVDMFNEFPNTDIILASSADRGANWTFAVVDSSAGTEFLPWVTVDQTTAGVHVAYYTTDGAPNNTEVNLRLASSFDGGITFTRVQLCRGFSRIHRPGSSPGHRPCLLGG